jgi:hypothetical protein
MKKNLNHRFWQFGPRLSLALSMVLLAGLLLVLVVLKRTNAWPVSEQSDTAVLIGILLFSLLPVLLSIIDVIIERGGTIEYKGVKINFAQVPQMGVPGFAVPTNIGVPAQAISDSDTTQILDALRKATACEVVEIDLEEGQAWWETRLLVLLAGAVRLGRPQKIVFVGTDGGVNRKFQGWGHPYELLPRLMNTQSQYLLSYQMTQAATRQWELVEPNDPPDPVAIPQLLWPSTGIAANYSWMAQKDGLPNPLLAEQMLAAELGRKIELQEKPKAISLVRLDDLFRPVLHTRHIDERWKPERQLEAFFEIDSDYIAVTQKGRYRALISKVTVLNTIVKSLL